MLRLLQGTVISFLPFSSSLKTNESLPPHTHRCHSSIPPPLAHLSCEGTRGWFSEERLKSWEMERGLSMHWALSPFNLWVIMVFTNIRNPLISKHQALFKSLPDCATPPRKILQLSLSPSHSLMALHAPQTHHLPPNNQNGALALSSFHVTSYTNTKNSSLWDSSFHSMITNSVAFCFVFGNKQLNSYQTGSVYSNVEFRKLNFTCSNVKKQKSKT